MANRYLETEINVNDKGKRIYLTTIFPTIPVSNDDTYIVSRDGDRLDLLANRFYGDSTLWWIIAQANSIGKGTFYITPGIRLRIPANASIVTSQLKTVQDER